MSVGSRGCILKQSYDFFYQQVYLDLVPFEQSLPGDEDTRNPSSLEITVHPRPAAPNPTQELEASDVRGQESHRPSPG